jgi:uncharacterized Zn-finger protein
MQGGAEGAFYCDGGHPASENRIHLRIPIGHPRIFRQLGNSSFRIGL